LANLILFGAGDMARQAQFYFTRQGEHRVVAFTVDREYRKADTFLDLPLVDFEEVARIYPPAEFKMFIAAGYRQMNQIRASKCAAARTMGYELVSHLSLRCSYLSQFPPGDNCFLFENVIVEPFARIGRGVTIWSGSLVAHDAVVEDCCFIAPHAVISGHTRVGENCFVGVGATVRDGITLGPRTLVGAGAVIMEDTEPDSIYVSQPATKLGHTSDHADL
jgi:sugar O-acyltransferase (sialic acid O-acetyltransferase NeuD family)